MSFDPWEDPKDVAAIVVPMAAIIIFIALVVKFS